MELAAGQRMPFTLLEIRVRQIDREHDVVGINAGTEQQRLVTAQPKLEPRQITCAAVIQTVFLNAQGADIAKSIEDAKGIAVFENTRSIVATSFGRTDVVR
jgi:hypothetical protein